VNDTALLRSLAGDEVANVRTAALTGLAETEGRRADPLLLASLETASEPQLVLTLAGLLAETDLRDDALAAALGALERLSERREQTLRDPRVALLTLVGRVGGPTSAPEIEPYIRDADRRVADLAAGILLDWTGDRYISAPRRPEGLPLPTAAELRELLGTSVVLHMARGGAITIQLHADERTPHPAPTNAFRFVRMARAGVFDGLTFHRVAPNFVVQGGSPDANEYSGHGAYTRDEVGLPAQWRGTVGISTRGRDTGDGQIYINLVDNTRLDHDYTIIGTVTGGMDVVDAIVEGDVIERAEVRTGG
jgi:cyclophilin family peptidyl-prolyl cis-trans isomerase